MGREKEFVKNTAILGLGKMLPKITSFITLPILTAKLTKLEYGTYDLIATLIMLVIPIATLQIQSAAFRFLIDCRGKQAESSRIISNIFIITVPITAIVSFLIQLFFGNFSVLLRVFISLYFFLDTYYLTCAQVVRGIGKNLEYSISSVIVSFVNMLCVVLMVQVVNKGLYGVLLALTIANLIGSIYLITVAKLYTYFNRSLVSAKVVKDLLAYSWPMVPNNLSTWVLKLSDRLVITAFLGIEANAVYAVANKLPNLLSMAQSVMVMAWHENASIVVNDQDASDYFSQMLDSTFSLMYGITVLLIAGTPYIFWLLIRGDYGEAYYQMPLLILAMFFFVMSSYFGGIYIAHKKTKNVGISTMVAAGINLAVDLLLVNIIGIWAGSISTLAAYALLYYYRMFNVQKFQKIRVNLKKQAIQILAIIIMLILCFMRNEMLNIVNIVLGACLFAVSNKELAVKLTRKLKRRIEKNEI